MMGIKVTFAHGARFKDGWPFSKGEYRLFSTWVSPFSGKRIIAVAWFRLVLGKDAK